MCVTYLLTKSGSLLTRLPLARCRCCLRHAALDRIPVRIPTEFTSMWRGAEGGREGQREVTRLPLWILSLAVTRLRIRVNMHFSPRAYCP